MEHMKNVARGLENKIIELQQKLTEKVKFLHCSDFAVKKRNKLAFCLHLEEHIFSISDAVC